MQSKENDIDMGGKNWGRFWVKRIFIWIFALVVTAAIALRVEAAIRARQIVSVVTGISTLRLGETSQADALQRISTLHRSTTGLYGASRCDADECFSAVVENGLPGRVLWGTENKLLSDVLRWLGFRAEGISISVHFTSGRVSYFGYHLMVSAPGVPATAPPPPPDGKLGLVVIELQSQRTITSKRHPSTAEINPPYQIGSSRAVPSQSIGISLTPDAPEGVVRAAFDFRLRCIWSFGGCRQWDQILPAVKPLVRK